MVFYAWFSAGVTYLVFSSKQESLLEKVLTLLVSVLLGWVVFMIILADKLKQDSDEEKP